MTIPKLIQKYRTNLDKTALKLTKSMKLEDFPVGEVKDALVYAYASQSVAENALAVVINAAVASKKTKFILSRALLIELFKNDPNLGERVFNGTKMKEIMVYLVGSGLLERLSDAVVGFKARRKAATYGVTSAEVLSLITDQTRALTLTKMDLNPTPVSGKLITRKK